MEIALGVIDGKLVAAPFDSIVSKLNISKDSKEADKIVVLIQGDKKPSDVAKIISQKLEHNDLDDIITKLPSGTFSIVDDRKIKEKLLDRKYKK
jgi:aspartate carbamoyltransferase regulatory subunit